MEIGMREILIVLGCMIMAVLFIDAYRRVRDHRRSQLGFRLHDEPSQSRHRTLEGFDDDELADDELTPVRPVERRSDPMGHGQVKRAHESSQTPKQIRVRISTPKSSERTQSPLDHASYDRPLFEEESTEKAGTHAEPQASIQTDGQTDIKMQTKSKMKGDLFPGLQSNKSDGPIKALLQPALATAPEAGDFYSNRRNSQAAITARKQQAAQQKADPRNVETRHFETDKTATNKVEKNKNQPQGSSQPDEVIMMHVAAGGDDMFDGEILVQHLLSLNMRHGEMKIFHRYERPEQHQGLLFSMANMVKPGYFELDHMSAFETPGVTFFLTLPCVGGGLYAFDLMVDTARKLAKAVDGELRDDTQSVITAQTVEHFRQRVMEFERKQRMLEKTRQIRERSKLLDE